jgi:hypothetical protein
MAYAVIFLNWASVQFHPLGAPPSRATGGDDLQHVARLNLLIIFIEDLGARFAPHRHPILQGIDAFLGDDVQGESPPEGGFSDVQNLRTGIVATMTTFCR